MSEVVTFLFYVLRDGGLVSLACTIINNPSHSERRKQVVALLVSVVVAVAQLWSSGQLDVTSVSSLEKLTVTIGLVTGAAKLSYDGLLKNAGFKLLERVTTKDFFRALFLALSDAKNKELESELRERQGGSDGS